VYQVAITTDINDTMSDNEIEERVRGLVEEHLADEFRKPHPTGWTGVPSPTGRR
jgi:hypothetical protein